MAVNIPLYIQYGQIGQFSLANKYANDAIFNGVNLVPSYISLLRTIQETVSDQYSLSGSTPALEGLANYMLALSGVWPVNTTPVATPFIIVTQPQSQTVNAGTNVSFIVVVSGGVQPYTYQWKKNGLDLSGETAQTLSLTSVTSGDAGNYSVVITDNTGQVLTSNNALLLVVAAAITGSYYYGDTDYFAALSAGTDAISYQGTFSITHNAPIVPPYPLAAGNNKMLVIRVPVGESLKTTWFNTAFNNGTIQPSDGIFRVPLTPAGLPLYTYYLTELASSFDFNNPNVLTLS